MSMTGVWEVYERRRLSLGGLCALEGAGRPGEKVQERGTRGAPFLGSRDRLPSEGEGFKGWLLAFAAERARVRPGVERFSTLPAKPLLRDLAGLQALADVVELRRLMVDVGGRRQVLEELARALVAPADLGGEGLHHDVGDLARDLAVADLRGRAPAEGHHAL